jgi:hypothetical protein
MLLPSHGWIFIRQGFENPNIYFPAIPAGVDGARREEIEGPWFKFFDEIQLFFINLFFHNIFMRL